MSRIFSRCGGFSAAAVIKACEAISQSGDFCRGFTALFPTRPFYPRNRRREAVLAALEKCGIRRSDGKSEILDLETDGGYIYAAFLAYYGIDLHRDGRRLRWEEFTALFHSLPKDCKICEIMRLRGTELPKGNSAAADRLARLKARYALRNGNFQDGLAAAAEGLRQIGKD